MISGENQTCFFAYSTLILYPLGFKNLLIKSFIDLEYLFQTASSKFTYPF